MLLPHIIDFDTNGSSEAGFLSVGANISSIPFVIKRLYWIYGQAQETTRGSHAHRKGDQVLIAMCGNLRVELEDRVGKKYTFILDSASKGLFVPGIYWRSVFLEKGAVLLSVCSTEYDKHNYIRSYKEFKELKA